MSCLFTSRLCAPQPLLFSGARSRLPQPPPQPLSSPPAPADPRHHVRALYAKLHAAGVLHGDVRWVHVRRRGTALRLIDFDRACARADYGEREWAHMCEAERGAVENMLKNPVESS